MYKRVLLPLAFILSFLLLTSPVEAAESSIEEVSSEEDGTITYEFNGKNIITNVSDGATVEIAYFELDEGLTCTILRGGQQYPADNNVIYENGDYIAMIYDTADNSYASMSFTVSNEIFGSSGFSVSDNEGRAQGGAGDISYITEESLEKALEGDMSAFDSVSTNTLFELDSEMSFEKADMQLSYSEALGNLVYSIGDKPVLDTNIPNGAIVSTPVMVHNTNGVAQYIYYNGEMILNSDDNIYRDPGYYDVVSYIYDLDSSKVKEGGATADDVVGSYETHFSFAILDKYENSIGLFTPPEGFHFYEVKKNGVAEEVGDSEYFFLTGDGKYEVTYEADFNNDIKYTASLNLDTVAPFAIFSTNIEVKSVKEPVTINLSDNNSYIRVKKDGRDINYHPGDEIKENGFYDVIIYDDAGNVREYDFYMYIRPKFFTRGMVILLVTVLAGGIIYLIASGKSSYKV